VSSAAVIQERPRRDAAAAVVMGRREKERVPVILEADRRFTEKKLTMSDSAAKADSAQKKAGNSGRRSFRTRTASQKRKARARKLSSRLMEMREKRSEPARRGSNRPPRRSFLFDY